MLKVIMKTNDHTLVCDCSCHEKPVTIWWKWLELPPCCWRLLQEKYGSK